MAKHFGNVEPLEAETLECRQEILEPAVQIPVRPDVARGAELGSPGDELAALRVELFADRVDDDLADVEPAALNEALAAEIRRPARHAAPHVDAGVCRRTLVGVKLPAHRGMNAVAGDRNAAARDRTSGEARAHAPGILFESLAAGSQQEGIVTEPLA